MTETATPDTRRSRGLIIGLLAIALVVAGIVVVVLALGDDEDTATNAGASTPQAATPQSRQPPAVLERKELEALAAGLATPVYWAGARPGERYEVTRIDDGTTYVRYLPAGVEAGDDGRYLTVATYPRPSAFAEIQRAANDEGAETFAVGSGGIAVIRPSAPQSVNFAFPTVGAQVEVFSPDEGEARQLVSSGSVVPVGGTGGVVAPPFIATAEELRAFAGKLDGRTYWAGPRSGKEYEVTRTSDGAVFVRYLPAGTAPGAPVDVLTVATYPGRGGLTALRAAARREGAQSIRIPGGLAVYDRTTPTNVHLAFAGGDEQIEVYARTGIDVPALVRSGKIVALDDR